MEATMSYQIQKAAVIGAGTMGAAIAAHLANAGIPVLLLDIVPKTLTSEQEARSLSLESPEVRNSIARGGLDRAVKSRPASFMSAERVALVDVGNLEDDFARLSSVDWIIEVIIENLVVKQDLMRRIDEIRSPKTIISTNTSGIPIAEIQAGLSDGFRQHFLGTHFFNPPRYLKLLEIIPSPDTLPDVIQAVSHFCEYRLGKGIVLSKDTPNFIGNRMAFGSGAFALDYIVRNGYTVEEVDAITGPLMGRPKTATFRLIDLVGVDVWEHVGKNLVAAIPHDQNIQPYLRSEAVNNLIGAMVQKGWLGNKTKIGFYKQVQVNGKRDYWSLDFNSLEHIAPQKPRFESVGKARNIEDLGERMAIMLAGEDRAADLVRAITYQGFAYASACIPEIGDTPKPIDDAMRWGFSHDLGPFEMWDLIGVQETAAKMKTLGYEPASWVEKMLQEGNTSFYNYESGRAVGVYNPTTQTYHSFPKAENILLLKDKRSTGKVLLENPGASFVDLGDGVGCIEFHTKMNALDDDIFTLADKALDLVEKGDFVGIVVGNDAENFSAGANLAMVLLAAHMGMWDTLTEAVTKLQNLNMRMRYFPKPVVIAPAGLTLGGGSEVMMHGSRVVVAAELYAGLVEVGVGVIPAGGGTKEILRRVLNPPMKTNNADPLPYLQRIFEQVGMAKVGTSAEEVRQLGLLSDCDRVVMNRSHQIAEAKKEVLRMADAGYVPPLREKVYAAGRDALAALRVGIYMYWKAGQITEYDKVVAEQLAYVMTGGELSLPAWMDEQYFLDLEKEAFLFLCGQEGTRARMKHMLDTGKPLRN
jgi:3-hydroxyacyl-CoA dehydrogenase